MRFTTKKKKIEDSYDKNQGYQEKLNKGIAKNQSWLRKTFEKLSISITKVKIVERKKFEKLNKGITKIKFV